MGIIYKNWKKKSKKNDITSIVYDNLGIDADTYIKWYDMVGTDTLPRPYNMAKAVRLAKMLADEGFKFVICGDYDADGLTATSILLLGLKKYGVKELEVHIPDRLLDGYGTTAKMIDEIKPKAAEETGNKGPKIAVIFVDNGIKCFDAVNECVMKDYVPIILDHHDGEAGDNHDPEYSCKVPNAKVIVDPCVYDCDDTDYCGAGISYIFIRDLLKYKAPDYHTSLLPLAAIGTVADVMPLTEGNYAIVRDGLLSMAESFNRNDDTGLNLLLGDALPYNKIFDAKDIGFTIAPIINAQSRMRGKKGEYDVITVLISEKIKDNKMHRALETLCDRLLSTNDDRKSAKNASIEEAEKYISDNCLYGDNPLVCYLPETSEGIIGITAGYLAEKYKVAAYVFTDGNEEGILKGSGRSAGDYNMVENLDRLYNSTGVYFKYGGHPGAAGLSIKKGMLPVFTRAMQDYVAEKPYKVSDSDSLFYDIEVTEKKFYEKLDSYLKKEEHYCPFGEKNPEIRFRINGFHVSANPKYKNLFMGGKSVRLYGRDNVCCIGFNMADKISDDIRTCDIVGTLRRSYFGGNEAVDIEILDLSDTTETVEEICEETPFAKMLREMSK